MTHPEHIDGEETTAGLVPLSDDRLARLRRFNAVMGVVHAISAVAMVALGNDFALGVTTFNLNGPPGTPVADGTVAEAFSLPLAPAVAAFMALSAVFHLFIASPLGISLYASELRHGQNRIRWVEYSLSSTLMIVLIALVTGITDLAALIAIAFANAAMILFGWLMETFNEPSSGGVVSGGRADVRWSPFWFGCVAGIGPWVALVVYLLVNVNQAGAEQPPGFVYGIIVTIFVLFNCFAVNQWLQYRGVGKWRDYLFGETVYIWLSLVAKSALGWQIFANTLID